MRVLRRRSARASDERPPRLCMVVHSHYPVGEPRVEREARAARDAGFRVEVVALRQPGELQHEVVDGIHVHRLPLSHVRGGGIGRVLYEYAAFTLLAALRVARLNGRHRFSVVHVHAPPDFLILAGLAPKLLGARLLLDIHDLSPDMYGARFGQRPGAGLLSRLLIAVERTACRVADRVITVHEPYRGELIARGLPPDKAIVVMNSADESLIARVQRSSPNGARQEDAFTVAYHGTINDWYGVDLLVSAMARLPPNGSHVRARILGDGDALARVRTLAADLGVDDRVEFSGRYLPLEETLCLVAGARCGVIPNRPTELNRFALSTKLFEYVALGIPVVVSRLETLAAHFGPSEVTFFEPGDSESLAEAIRWVMEHPDDARAKAQRASAHASVYSWRENRTRYLQALG